jgi:hypothetical protein
MELIIGVLVLIALAVVGVGTYVGVFLFAAGTGAFGTMVLVFIVAGALDLELCEDCFSVTPAFFVIAAILGLVIAVPSAIVDGLLGRRVDTGWAGGAAGSGALLGAVVVGYVAFTG